MLLIPHVIALVWYSYQYDLSDLCCFPCFSLNYCFAAVVLIATNKVEYTLW